MLTVNNFYYRLTADMEKVSRRFSFKIVTQLMGRGLLMQDL